MLRTITFKLSMVCLLPVLTISTVSAVTIRVPADQPTIQAGIEASVDGDTVLVADGTYAGAGNQNLDYIGRAITVVSENGPDMTVIDCGDDGRGFNFISGENRLSLLAGFKIINGKEVKGGGIRCVSSSPTIRNCTISENSLEESGRGGGIYVESSDPVIENCLISDNFSPGAGGGIYCLGSAPAIQECRILNNSSYYSGGGIYCTSLHDEKPVIAACVISRNSCREFGGGICVQEDCDPIITNCVISDNSAKDGGGLGVYGNEYYGWDASPTISNCIISENNASWYGAGIRVGSATCADIVNCTIVRNTAPFNGGGIYARGSSSYCHPDIINCIVWNNSPDQIDTDLGARISVSYSDIMGSWEGPGNINEMPLFANLHGIEFLLKPESPCVDAGRPNITDAIYDGHPRWPGWFPNGSRSDMGAYGGERNWIWLWMREVIQSCQGGAECRES